MKKMLLTTALALPQDVLNRRLLFRKQTGGSSTKETITLLSSFLELGGKLSMQPKFVAAQKMLKQKPANIRKWIAPVLLL